MESLLKYSYQIPYQILRCGQNTKFPVYGEALLKYPYQIPDQILDYGHNTQIPVYGVIITQVCLQNP
jgi:hypothetical protein